MPKVSVIIPTFNRGNLINNAIKSVLEQIYQDFGLIVVDDCSTDDTAQSISLISDPRLIFIRHEINKGAAAARNTGMKLAKGEYIAFLDSDDFWSNEKLEKQVKFLQDSNPEIGGCVHYYRLQFADDFKIRKIEMEPNFYNQSLKGCNLSPGSTLMFKKECLDKVGYQNETLNRFEDWEWQIRFAQHYKWIMLPKVLADVKAGHFVSFEIAKKTLNQFEKLTENLPKKDFKIIKMAIYYELFYAAFKNRLYGCSLYYLLSAFFKNPLKFFMFISSLLQRKVKELSN